MALFPLKLPPGVYRGETELASAGRWYDANLVRWYQGAMQPIKGWRKRTNDAVTGRACGIYSWRDNTGISYLAVGTHSKAFVYSAGIDRYDITPAGFTAGRENAANAVGYGTGVYGGITYGTPRQQVAGAGILPATTWSFDNFGQYLVGCATTDGKIYKWELNTANPMAVLTNAPTGCTGVMVTEERFVFALGADGNPRKIKWSDQEDWQVWTPAATNQAGDFELQTPGEIVTGKRVRGGTLVLTTTDAHFARYLGAPYVYGFERVGSECGAMGCNAVVSIDVGAVWMAENGFWLFDGYPKPLPSDVADFVYADLNYDQKSKIHAFHHAEFSEVWWLYPSGSSNNPDRYVVWNYRENHWNIGSLSREVGIGQGVFKYPILISRDGFVYEHDVGWDFDGAQPYALSGPYTVGDGGTAMSAKQLIPDEKNQGDVRIVFKTRNYPNAAQSSYGPYTMATPTSVRFTAKQISMEVRPYENNDWRVGIMKLDVDPAGRR